MNEPYLLPISHLEKYKNKPIPWGFMGLGFIVFKRTYARIQDNGKQEEWGETILRCINGAQEIGANYSEEEAIRLFDYMYNLKCSFAGRMLWMLGTKFIKRWGGNALCNCFFISITEPEDFCFLFENLMMGGGVGYSVRREDVHELPKIKENVKIIHLDTKDTDFIVPDSREGWVALLRKVLRSYFTNGKSFSYSTILVRGYGEKIKGLGGTASGSSILIEGIENICKIFNTREGKKLRSIDVLDACNIIASIVISGNLRRSASIALGDPDDYLFLRAKRWDLGNIPNWRSLSNNTIYCDDYSHISNDVWEGYKGNGEPYGFFNLPLAKKYGRIGELVNDKHILGINPCCSGDTRVLTPNGEKTIIDFLHSQDNRIICMDGKARKIKKVEIYFNKDIYLIKLENKKEIKVTSDHKFYCCKKRNKKISIYRVFTKNLSELEDDDYIEIYNGSPSKIKSLEYIGKETVYDLYEPITDSWITNGIVSLGCGEINLPSGGVCCLSELFLNNIKSKEELIDCAKLLYKTQKAVCGLTYLHEKTNKVVHRDYRIGISVTGICQSIDKLEWLDETYKEIKRYDKEYSKLNNLPESIKLTTCKPSGTISLLSGSSPGIHPAFSKYYIRRVRMSSNDPLIEQCKAMGYKAEYVKGYDGENDYKTILIEFPCFAGDKVIEAKDMSAIKQLELLKKLQSIWADNSVSCTIYFRKEELEDIKIWLKENYNDHIKAVSFLLHQEHGFEQAPYEEITKEKYEELISKVKPLTSLIIKEGDNLIEECKGACPIK